MTLVVHLTSEGGRIAGTEKTWLLAGGALLKAEKARAKGQG